MTKIDSIPSDQLTALMDLILEKATEVQKEKERRTHQVTDASKMAHQSHLHFSKLNTKKPN